MATGGIAQNAAATKRPDPHPPRIVRRTVLSALPAPFLDNSALIRATRDYRAKPLPGKQRNGSPYKS
jgi:hypothetical protein